MILTPGHLTKIIVSTFLISVEMRAREKSESFQKKCLNKCSEIESIRNIQEWLGSPDLAKAQNM